MKEFTIVTGKGRTAITLQGDSFGNDVIVRICNENTHIGAVAIGEYDKLHQRASVSVHTRLGHKDDAIAQKAAYTIAKSLKKPVCVIAGVHIDDITPEEIKQVLDNAETAVNEFIRSRK
jgi:gallate decarboxylase subunit D